MPPPARSVMGSRFYTPFLDTQELDHAVFADTTVVPAVSALIARDPS